MVDHDPTAATAFDVDARFAGELTVEDFAAAQGLNGLAPPENAGAAPVGVADVGPQGAGAALEAESAAPARPLAPRPPVPESAPAPARTRLVSGRYEGTSSVWRLDLRVDIDGTRPLGKISGDFYRLTGRTVTYYGSVLVDSPHIAVDRSAVTITGTATATFGTTYSVVRVTIPRVPFFARPGDATLQFFTPANQPGASYTCAYASPYFRTVEIEEDHETGVTPFLSYDTGSLPSGGSARALSVAGAYAEAGILVQSTGGANEVAAPRGGVWSNAELHLAMEEHFTRWRDEPQWKVWLFHALRHEFGPNLLGIMFDEKGRPRQGCAVFYQAIAGSSPGRLRDQLYTCVHELGHCFNLFHSFHKSYMDPPLPNRPRALSWMNYPQRYPDGTNAFWAAFPFQFDALETAHLRHGFRDNVVIGGNPFGVGAALEIDADFADPIEDHSGLALELRAKPVFDLGEPVVVEIKLAATDTRGKTVHADLHPDASFVEIAIQNPSGDVAIHDPMMHRCVAVETVELTPERPAVYDSAYIGYGHDGLVFGQPGVYRLRARYHALDGSEVVSNVLPIRVRSPLSQDDDSVAELLLGEEQGKLFALLGSDSEFLRKGNDALDTVLERHGDHRLAVYARLAEGFNMARAFKRVTPAGKVETRPAQVEQANQLLGAVVEATEKGEGVDNVTLNQTMRRIATTQRAAGDRRGAERTIKRMVELFKKRITNAAVLQTIESQGRTALAAEDPDA